MRPGSESHLRRRRAGWDTRGVLLDEPVAPGALYLPGLFGNTRPVELEIGAGKGAFLLARARARPELNLLGVERARAYCRYAADRVRRAGLENVRMVCADAEWLVHSCLRNRCLWRVHVYFPDPWPKHRHRRRRLLQAAFLADVRRLLLPGGQLLVVTDHLDYLRQIQASVEAVGGFARVPFPQMADRNGELVGTNFERKYIARGRNIYKLACLCYA